VIGPHDPPRWAPRVPRRLIERLYQSDAEGRLDEELLNEVFFAFLARCQSILTVTAAAFGTVACPRCATAIVRVLTGSVEEKSETVACPSCAWSIAWPDYHRGYQHKQLMGGNAIGVFQEFVRRATQTATATERMLLVDWIVHEAHKTIVAGQHEYHRPTAINLIEGTMRQLVAFLDRLAHGPGSSPSVLESAERWRETVRPRLGRKGVDPAD
jgi:endogenous inhibitor of DNA gyrase (YacG/DUF329 family)